MQGIEAVCASRRCLPVAQLTRNANQGLLSNMQSIKKKKKIQGFIYDTMFVNYALTKKQNVSILGNLITKSNNQSEFFERRSEKKHAKHAWK